MTTPHPKDPSAGFAPFADDAAVLTIGGLSLENGTARITLHGSLDLTRDRAGLDHARTLAASLADIVRVLEATEGLPEAVAEATRPATSVRNPFA